jgi:hypothetical protein
MSRRSNLEAINLLELAPQRAAQWEEADDQVILLRPPPSGRGLRRLGDWLLCQLSARRIRLDDVGSFVWKGLDGATTVGELAVALEGRFGERVAPAAERLGRMVRVLHREGFLAYPGVDTPE